MNQWGMVGTQWKVLHKLVWILWPNIKVAQVTDFMSLLSMRHWKKCLRCLQIVSRKKMSEFGTNLDLVEDRDDPNGSTSIRLPGSRKGDMSSRAHRPEVRVSGLQFAPTGREFTATTTEGLLVYSLDNSQVQHYFSSFGISYFLLEIVAKKL